jgi:hypothetical protein
LPSVQKLYEEIDGRDDLAILAVNSGTDSKDVIESYWKKAGFDFPAVRDVEGQKGANSSALGVMAFPTNLVVGPDGKVLFASVGFNEPVIRKYLGL